jgi:hypothetical protein
MNGQTAARRHDPSPPRQDLPSIRKLTPSKARRSEKPARVPGEPQNLKFRTTIFAKAGEITPTFQKDDKTESFLKVRIPSSSKSPMSAARQRIQRHPGSSAHARLGITMQKMREAIRASNADVGGCTVELSEFEYVIRGFKGINDLGNIPLKTNKGTPVLLCYVARAELGLDERYGIS